MAVLDKKLLLADLKERLDDYIPANTAGRIITDLGEILLNYEVNAVPPDDGGTSVTTDNEQIIQMYIDAREMSGLADTTLKEYRYRINKMVDGIGLPIQKITVFHLRQFLMSEKNRGTSMTTLKTYQNSYTSFFAWLHREGIIDKDPTANLDQIKAKATEKTPFSAAEIQIIKESCDSDKQLAIVHFLLSTGCRVSELCSVNRSDIDYQNLKLSVVGKGSKKRTVYIDSVTAMMLRRYLETRQDIDPALFLNRNNTRYNKRGIEKMLAKLGEQAHVPCVHPHRFRHTLATTLIARGMPIQEVAAILGHAKIETTMTYVHLDQRNTENSYRRHASM